MAASQTADAMATPVAAKGIVKVVVEDKASADLTSHGASLEEQIKNVVARHSVVVFGKTWCPFCIEAVRTLEALGVHPATFNIDQMPNGAAVQAQLKANTNGHVTVPYIFISGGFIGGCDDLKAKQASGDLHAALRNLRSNNTHVTGDGPVTGVPVTGDAGVVEGATVPQSLFWFPQVLDDRVVRLTGVFTFIIALLVAVFFERPATRWVMGGLMIDFVLRLFGGGSICPLGALAQTVTAVMELFGSKPRWVAGPPKQFAVVCGVLFTSIAFLFFLLVVHAHACIYVGLAFTCALAMCAALEGFAGFCVGCFFFQLGVQFGLVSPRVYMLYANSRAEQEYAYAFANQVVGDPLPAVIKRPFEDGKSTSVDLSYKPKTDDMTKEDVNVIKNTKITHSVVPLSLAGLGLAFMLAAQSGLGVPNAVHYTIGLAAATILVVWALLFVARNVVYGVHKTHREWMCELRGHSFAIPCITLMLLAALVADQSLTFAKVLFWMGAPMNLLLGLVRFADWIACPKDIEHVNSAWMMAPVGCFVAALVGPALDPNYVPAMQLWFAFAFMSWLLLFAMVFARAVLVPDNDDRMRPLVWIWVAAPAVACMAYLYVFPGSTNDFVFMNLYWMGIALALVFLFAYRRPLWGRIPFNMALWSGGFPSAALAGASVTYYQLSNGDLAQGVAVTLLVTTGFIHAVLILQTLTAILRGRAVFTPEYKYGPLSFMKLTHEAFRAFMPHLRASAAAIHASKDDPAASTTAIGEFAQRWRLFSVVLHEHSKHEDNVIFKAFDDLFPGVAAPFAAEHEAGHVFNARIDAALAQLLDPETAKGVDTAALLADVDALIADFLAHLRREEDHMSPIGKRYVPLATAKQIVVRVWAETPARAWFTIMPWVINNLPMLQQRERYIKCFLWAMPEKAQHIGSMVALGVDATNWHRISSDLPEIIPRGAAGWTRYG